MCVGTYRAEPNSKNRNSRNSGFLNKISSLFFNYENLETKLYESAVFTFISKLYHKINFIKFLKKSISKKAESSKILGEINKFVKLLPVLSLRSYSIITFFIGIILVIFNAFKLVANIDPINPDAWFPIGTGALLVLISGIMSVSQKPVGVLINESLFLSGILFNILSFDKKEFDTNLLYTPNSFVLIFFGISLGILSAAFNVLNILFYVFVFILAVSVIKKPEAGIILTCLLLPFINGTELYLIIGLSCISVLLKVLRNKRVLKFGLFDLGALFFALTILLCGAFGLQLKENFINSFSILILFAFGWMLSNTMKTTELSGKCIKALTVSVTTTSLLGFLTIIINSQNINKINFFFNYISEFSENIAFVHYEYFALFSVLIIPFILAFYKSSKLLSILALVINFVYIIVSGNIALWISAILVFIIYFGIKRPVLFLYFVTLVATIVALKFVFPDLYSLIHDFLHSFSNHKNIDQEIFVANNYGIKSALQFYFSGAGNGQGVVQHIFNSNFGYGNDVYANSSSYFISLLVKCGITGIISLLCCLSLFASNCLGLALSDRYLNKECIRFVVSCLSGICAFALSALLFPFFLTDNMILFIIIILYIPVAIGKGLKIEYVPSYIEVGYEE